MSSIRHFADLDAPPFAAVQRWGLGEVLARALVAMVYQPRRPERDALYRVLDQHLDAFIDELDEADRRLPPWVEVELRDFLRCGRPGHGFPRFR